MKFRGLGLISAMTFWQKTFRQEDFSAWGNFGTRTFQHGYILPPWMFQQRNVRALGHFGTRIFWHMDVLAHIHFGMMQCNRHFSKDISACVSLCQNVHMPKCLSIQKFDFFNDLKLHNYLKNKILRAHAARHTPSCLWHFPKHLKSFDGCQQSHGPDIFVPNGLSHNPTFLWLPLCAIARLSALMPTNCGVRKCLFFGFRYRP